MSFAAGVACGISAGRSQTRKECAANFGRLEAGGQIRPTDAESRLITPGALLGVLMLGAVLALYLIST